MGFHEISYSGFLIKVVNKSHVLKKQTKVIVTLHEHLDTFLWGTTWGLQVQPEACTTTDKLNIFPLMRQVQNFKR